MLLSSSEMISCRMVKYMLKVKHVKFIFLFFLRGLCMHQLMFLNSTVCNSVVAKTARPQQGRGPTKH